MSRLPSLRALRAFQVAGTYLNLSDAADELCITASGVSHQIRLLEEELGVKLFNRTGRGLELTDRGGELLPVLTGIFDNLASAIGDFKTNRKAAGVNIAMPTSFASRWFIPNLGKFEAQHPDVDIRLSCHEVNDAKARSELDCVIHFGHADWNGYREYMLFSEKLIAVCSPRHLRDDTTLTHADIGKHRLLKVKSQPSEWEMWARGTGVQIPPKARTLTFETREFALQGAFEGLGLALAGLSEVSEDIRHGRLTLAFDSAPVVSGTYFLLIAEQRTASPSVVALTDWIRQEFSDSAV
ncbi:Transcriptional regulator [Paraburkholderia caribensis MBA4]|uniref:Transcriptional regulator n=1 Tax=Paraburkholderia caribensis MBA4 TaxID=1323664 RepID=A0A0P0RIZ1_9BURK|nr:LysR substrate-binding domain-containing protein [Paraburkholderia caribensis]ALL68398.1 Transcriptional regulator [Paraburkholderia caribensis MBA4]